jgi:hypothetical protein
MAPDCKKGASGHSPRRFHGPSRRRACGGENLEKDRREYRKYRKYRKFNWPRAGSASNPTPQGRQKRLAENAEIDGNEILACPLG